MEKIQKNISIESSISRLPGLIPSIEMGFYKFIDNKWAKIYNYDGSYINVFSKNNFDDINQVYFLYGIDAHNGNWGKVVNDIDFTKLHTFLNNENIPSQYEKFKIFANLNELNLPFIIDNSYDDENQYHLILRHRTMMTLYYWLKDYYNNITYYKLCKRNDSLKWIETLQYSKDSLYDTYNELPSIDDTFNINDIIGINENSSLVKEYFNNEENSLLFIKFVEESIGKLIIPDNINGNLVPNFLFYSEIQEWYNWLISNDKSQDCCIIEKYNAMGGDLMKDFLSDKLNLMETNTSFFKEIVAINLLSNNINKYPYIDIPLYVENDVDDIGEFTIYAKEWVGGNRYYVGDTVVYVSDDDLNGSSYTLKKGDMYELVLINEYLYNSLAISSSYTVINCTNYDDVNEFCNSEINNGNGNFISNSKKIIIKNNEDKKTYLPLAYYCGFYNEDDKQIYFDDVIDGKIILNHWKPNSELDDIRSLNIDGYNENWPKIYVYDNELNEWSWVYPNKKLSSQIESKLSSLRRYAKSYDDNGNELPGILTYTFINDEKVINERLEFIYSVGEVHNLTYVEDNSENKTYYYGDIIDQILYSEDGVTFNETKNNRCKYIKFIYYIDVQLYEHIDENGSYWSIYESDSKTPPHRGTKYEETYNINIDVTKTDMLIDGKDDVTIIYDEIDYESNYSVIYSEDLNFAPIKVIKSNASSNVNDLFGKNEINDTNNIINSLLYKEEYKFGVATPIKRDVSVYVDRGINAAFEKHLILGETNTYQDLENYRNDYFNFSETL